VALFEHVVDEYDAGRPGYPAGVYDALGSLRGRLALDGGAGTGIATRALLDRGAVVVPFDLGPGVLRRATERTPGLPAVVADGSRLPFRDRVADLLCFAQSWHWLDPERRGAEAARVLRPGGRWAGWWSHARADGQAWFDECWSIIESRTVGRREHRDTDWGTDLARSGCFDVDERITVPWTRVVVVDTWLTELASHSYVASLAEPARGELLAAVGDVVRDAAVGDEITIAYETWLWIGHVRKSAR
jgi:SAM-dependent methyltransferase